ncbi:MAG: hypothetical protein JNK78_16985 [Planctomycetes bacterium]|nr:hypothetical protein [Planctomycetota bacterium]
MPRFVRLAVPFALAATVAAQNSTKKIRTAPSEVAAGAGSAVPWRESLDAALGEAKKTGKPVFWYVPAVAGSPMDRKTEIDRYMMGGPFSWPSTVELLASGFVPVREVARGKRAKELGLVRGSFIEPGWVVLDGDGVVVAKLDRITTQHPQWFEAPLRRICKQPIERFPCDAALADAWAAYRRGGFAEVEEIVMRCVTAAAGGDRAGDVALEGAWLRSVAAFRLGRRADAQEIWRTMVERTDDAPFVHKAALELEGHGPFVHGFEDYGALPDAVLTKAPVEGSRAPDGTYAESELWQRSAAFLVGMDDGDGVVRDSIYDFGGTDGLPNVHAAITCLVGEALLAASDRQARGEIRLAPAVLERVEAMLQRIRRNAESAHWLALSDRDEIVWARAYAIRFLAAWRTRRAGDAEALRPAMRNGVAALLALQPETGAWFHEYGNPFATATALQALYLARAAGVEVEQERVDRGLRALARNRTGAGAFTYGDTRKGEPRADVEGAAGRMPLCELGLFLFGASDPQRLVASIAAGQRHHGLLAAVRKYDDHADEHGYGGFFFWFDMLGRAEAIANVADREQRVAFAGSLHELVLGLPEFDGCFVDSHELGRCYGTAMALLCLDVLARCRQ